MIRKVSRIIISGRSYRGYFAEKNVMVKVKVKVGFRGQFMFIVRVMCRSIYSCVL